MVSDCDESLSLIVTVAEVCALKALRRLLNERLIVCALNVSVIMIKTGSLGRF